MKDILFAFAMMVLALSVIQPATAKNPAKWGKLSKSEIALKEVPFDKDADVVVLNNYGEMRFMPGGADPRIERHVRMKILKKEGTEAGDVKIRYRHEVETITGLKAQTLVIRNGKVEKVPVPKSAIFETESGPFHKEIRIAFPSVEPGAVIEYEYDLITKNYLYLKPFRFQSEYPTMQASFMALIHPDLGVKIYFHGSRLITKYASASTNTWELQNIEALSPEPYTWNLTDYSEWVEFRLNEYYTSSGYVNREKTWKQLTKELLDNPNFIGYTKKGFQMKETLKDIGVEDVAGRRKIEKIYDYVRNTYTWNNVYSLFPDHYPQFKAEKQGDMAAMNMLLIALLQEAGFDAHPVLIKLKYSGKVVMNLPQLNQFDAVYCLLDYDGKEYVLNAADRYLGFGQLREEDLNGKGYVVQKDGERWVNLQNEEESKATVMENVTIEEDMVKRKVTLSLNGLAAYEFRKAIDGREDNVGNMIRETYSFDGEELSNVVVTDLPDVDKPLKIQFDMATPLNSVGSLVMVKPFLIHPYDENPFPNERRKFPIDFANSFTNTYIGTITIPEGMQVEETPESIKQILRSNNGQLTFISQHVGNKVQVQGKMEISNPYFRVDDYPALRKIYENVVAKFNEDVVLKAMPQQP